MPTVGLSRISPSDSKARRVFPRRWRLGERRVLDIDHRVLRVQLDGFFWEG